MELAELRSWALTLPQIPQAVAVLRLIEAHERLGEQVRTQLADAMEERDKARAEAVALRQTFEQCEVDPEYVTRLEVERDKLAAFKKYVHDRLDAAGVPVDPESPHKAEGCRIGGRLDVLIGERDRLREAIWPGLPKWEPTAEQPLQDFYEAAAESLHDAKRVVS